MRKRRNAGLRRCFDLACAALGLILAAPLFAGIAIAIKVDDRGPIFYIQQRVGKQFQRFLLIKFRTMTEGADRFGLLTARSDNRVTRVGRFLRTYKLDELPQLFNVLRGDMQLVGARPEVDRYVEMFRPQYAIILQEKPGITDPASLAYRREEAAFSSNRLEQQYIGELLPDKLRLSMEYQNGRSFLSDIKVLLRTLRALTC